MRTPTNPIMLYFENLHISGDDICDTYLQNKVPSFRRDFRHDGVVLSVHGSHMIMRISSTSSLSIFQRQNKVKSRVQIWSKINPPPAFPMYSFDTQYHPNYNGIDTSWR